MFIKVSTELCLPNVCIKNKELIAKKPRVRGLGVNTEPLKKRIQTETTETAFKVKVFSLLKHKKKCNWYCFVIYFYTGYFIPS